MSPLTWLVTGSNRGIGLTLVRQLLQEPSNIVLAACRSPHTASHLHRLGEVSPGRLNVLQLDVTDLASITASVDSAKEVIGEHGLDYLVNNAGVGLRSDPMFGGETVQWADWLAYSLKVNTVGPALITKSYLPLLEKSRRPGVVMNISSRWSSFGRQGGAFSPTYSITKAALNMLTYKQAQERPNLIFFAMSPGWVQTEMGGPNAESTADESASALLSFAKRADKEHSGKLFDQDGSRMDW